MKYFILTFSILLSGCAGLAPVSETDLTFDRVVDAPGFTKDQIFEASKIWIAQNFRSAKAVLEYENKQDGKIIGNGSIKYPCSGVDCLGKGDWNALFTMQVDTKDQKFKMTFTNLRVSWPPSYSFGSIQSGHEGQIRTQGDLDAIKPALLKFGDQILESLKKSKTTTSW
jgi:hypothetical protein